jgi:hypothetical protein
VIAASHPLNTLIRSTSYTYKVFQHLILRFVAKGCNTSLTCLVSQSQWEIVVGDRRFSWFLTWIMLLWVMIETPHTLHTHSRSNSSINKVSEQRLLWLADIRMQPHIWSHMLHFAKKILVWLVSTCTRI